MLEDLYSNDLMGDPRTLGEEERTDALFWDEGQENREDDGDNADEVPDFDVAQNEPQGSQPVEPKRKKVVRNPIPKLNPDRLKGPRGIAILENVFQDFKFGGKGYEKKDLNQVMKRLEHWAHRLFPKFQFDDCLEKIETLGHKKPVMTYVKRIRMGLETAEMAAAFDLPADDQNIPDADLITELQSDPFDDLLAQQVAQSQPRPQQSVDFPLTQSPPSFTPPPKPALTEEQKERMRRNRLIAEQRLLARCKANQQSQISAEVMMSADSVLNSTAVNNVTDIRTCSQEELALNTLSSQPFDTEKVANIESSVSEGNIEMEKTIDYEISHEDQLSQSVLEPSVGNKKSLNEDCPPPNTDSEIGVCFDNEVCVSQELLLCSSEKEADSYNKCLLAPEGTGNNTTADKKVHSQSPVTLEILAQLHKNPADPNEEHLSKEEMGMEVTADNETCSQSLQTEQISAHQHNGNERSPSKEAVGIEVTDCNEVHSKNQQTLQTSSDQPMEEESLENTDGSL